MQTENTSSDREIAFYGVTKIFRTSVLKQKIALDDVTLVVPRGHVVGLLGPNGSGKSTMMKHLLGFLRPTRGEVLLFGIPAHRPEVRGRVGYLPENPRFQRFLRGEDALRYLGSLGGLMGADLEKRIEEMLELVELRSAAKEKIQGYSKGMVQRLAIAQALLARPDLLILDEPMSGLDPVGRSEVRRLVSRIPREFPGTTIFFSSHVLSDVEALCSHVVLLRAGKLLRSESLAKVLEEQPSQFEVLVPTVPASLRGTATEQADTRGVSLIADTPGALAKLIAKLEENSIPILSIQSRRRTLEEALFRDREGTAVPTTTKRSPEVAA